MKSILFVDRTTKASPDPSLISKWKSKGIAFRRVATPEEAERILADESDMLLVVTSPHDEEVLRQSPKTSRQSVTRVFLSKMLIEILQDKPYALRPIFSESDIELLRHFVTQYLVKTILIDAPPSKKPVSDPSVSGSETWAEEIMKQAKIVINLCLDFLAWRAPGEDPRPTRDSTEGKPTALTHLRDLIAKDQWPS